MLSGGNLGKEGPPPTQVGPGTSTVASGEQKVHGAQIWGVEPVSSGP